MGFCQFAKLRPIKGKIINRIPKVSSQQRCSSGRVNMNWKSIDSQREFMNDLFHKLNLNSLDDWITVNKYQLVKYGGRSLLSYYYNNDFQLLLKTLYPLHPWDISMQRSFREKDFFSHIENQKRFMGYLYNIFQLKQVEDWKLITKQDIKYQSGGTQLLSYYKNDYKKLLTSIYPEHEWNFKKERNKIFSITTIENQQTFLHHLYVQLNFNSLEDFLNITVDKLSEEDGVKELLRRYRNNYKRLLLSIFPNYPWKFLQDISTPNLLQSNQVYSYKFKSIERQREFMDKFYNKLHLKSLEDWKRVNKHSFLKNGAQSLIRHYYGDNLQKLLTSIYPYYPWSFEIENINCNSLYNQDYKLFKDFYQQCEFMDQLYYKLKFKSLDKWITTPKKVIIQNGGKYLIDICYSNDKKKLLMAIYPNYPWEVQWRDHHLLLVKRKYYFQSIENQRSFMDQLFRNLNFNSMDDFLKLPKKIIRYNLADKLLWFYSNDMQELLSNIYPFYPWNFEEYQNNDYMTEYFKSHENQCNFIDQIYKKLKITSLDEWQSITQNRFTLYGGKSLLKYYSNDIKKLFSTIFPNYPWNFENLKFMKKGYFKSTENQRDFMNKLFEKLSLNSLDDWTKVTKGTIKKNCGIQLLRKYNYNMYYLLSSIYPDHTSFQNNEIILFKSKNYFNQIENQKYFMDQLYKKLNLNQLDDWLMLKKKIFVKNGGENLLKYYSYNIASLLRSIYPHHQWNFNHTKFKPNLQYHKTFEYSQLRLKYLIKNFCIREKKDWYRLMIRNIDFKNILELLETVYPNETWDHGKFQNRSKKSNQRMLFTIVQQIFPSFHSLENYRHPLFLLPFNKDLDFKETNDKEKEDVLRRALEFDVFVGEMDVAFEYQGEHHYDEVPSVFGQMELHQSRDLIKKYFSAQKKITLICIPYWWNLSLPSLFSTVCQHICAQ